MDVKILNNKIHLIKNLKKDLSHLKEDSCHIKKNFNTQI